MKKSNIHDIVMRATLMVKGKATLKEAVIFDLEKAMLKEILVANANPLGLVQQEHPARSSNIPVQAR